MADEIDLCSEDGALKQLPSHLSAASGTPFFELRELCLVVRATTSGEGNVRGRTEKTFSSFAVPEATATWGDHSHSVKSAKFATKSLHTKCFPLNGDIYILLVALQKKMLPCISKKLGRY